MKNIDNLSSLAKPVILKTEENGIGKENTGRHGGGNEG